MDKEYTIVRSKESLEKAIEDNVGNIVIKGELAEELNMDLNSNLPADADTRAAVTVTGAGSIVSRRLLGVAALAAIPFTGGLSALAGASSKAAVSGLIVKSGFTATTGMAVTSIVAVSSLGIALILSVTDGYDRKFTAKAEGLAEATLELKKK